MQYLAPLNNDEPFKKVFGDPDISKTFLEDMLNVVIESIERLETDHKISSAASIVRFDFRCRISGQEVVIEMQNDYFHYLVKRFYLYHCLSTSLQLEVIKDKTEFNAAGKEIIIKRYTELKPVITIVWMAESNLGFTDDFVEFNTYPKAWADFIKDNSIWSQEKSEILTLRNHLLKQLNQEKDYNLDFHEQNRLIYVFQNNVVKNKRNQPYFKWFEFAHKTRNKNNQASDFKPFINNLIFSKMIQRLCTGFMEPDELRRMIGDEAYYAAKKLAEQDEEQNRLDKIYDQYHQAFGHELREERAEARMKLLNAYESFGVERRAFLAEKAKLEQALKEEQEKAKLLVKFEKEKVKKEQALLLKLEKEKAKKEKKALLKEKEKQEQLLKAEKEKQEQLLKAEKEKQEQLLKAEKEKQEQALQTQLKIVQKLWNKGHSVESIADLLEVSASQVQQWVKLFS
jgi:hypothetical protein